MNKINIAVIGCGSWGRQHIRVLRQSKRIRQLKICDLNIKTLHETAELYNIPHISESLKLINDPEIDAVTICTPTKTHYNLAQQALEAGKHVLVEKPMTNTIQEAESLIKTAQKNNLQLTVGFVERFNPAVIKALDMIKNSEIGQIILAQTRRVSQWPRRVGDVGVIKDLAIHDVDIINQVFPSEPISVFANAGSIQHCFEDYANIMICYLNNRNAFVETNWLTPRKVRKLIITGTEGLINVEYITQKLTVENSKGMYQPFIRQEEPLKLELENFIECILEDKPQLVSGEDGLKALRICEEAIESAQRHNLVNNQMLQ